MGIWGFRDVIRICDVCGKSVRQELMPFGAQPTIRAGNRAASPVHHRVGMDKNELQERSLRFAVAITRLTQAMRDIPDSRGPADQLSRCATSVGANYRAACRARSRAEFISKLGLVVEEIDEAVYWLTLMARAELTSVNLKDLLDEAQQLRAIFAASYGTARKNHQVARELRRRRK